MGADQNDIAGLALEPDQIAYGRAEIGELLGAGLPTLFGQLCQDRVA